jgi:hypothetical protein
MARLGAILGSTLVAALALSSHALAAPVLDQQQMSVDSSRQFPVRSAPERQMFAQVVRAGVPGLLTEIRVPISCYADSTLVLEIREATTDSRYPPSVLVPGSSVLASQTIPGATISSDTITFRSFVLANPPFIAAEQSFAIVLFVPPSSNSCSMHGGPVGDAYPRGVGFFDSHPNPPGWLPRDSDLAFATLVEARCRVPTVVGMALADVAAVLAKYGCAGGAIRREYSTSAPSETVVAQSPGEGTELPSGSAVDLVVSLGPPCTVPGLLRRPLAQARSALAQGGCVTGEIRREHSTAAPRGTVLSQSIAEGTQLPSGSAVDLVVSLGAHCRVPRLLGKTLAQARSALVRASCRLGTVRTQSAPARKRGRVVRQRPLPGTKLPNGARVRLVVGRRPRG